jgi:hypothetical protein
MILAVTQNRTGERIYDLKISADADYVFVALLDRIADRAQTLPQRPIRKSTPASEDNGLLLAIAGWMLQVNGGLLVADPQRRGALAIAAFPRLNNKEDI